jgi:hypothetical protein
VNNSDSEITRVAVPMHCHFCGGQVAKVGDYLCQHCIQVEAPRMFADRMNRATPEQVAQAMESLSTDVLEWAVKFEALSHPVPGPCCLPRPPMRPFREFLSDPERCWIVQRCTQQWIGMQLQLQYEDWPGYSESLMTSEEMMEALQECIRLWPMHEFRGHRVTIDGVPREATP